jgi:hypothetical protein
VLSLTLIKSFKSDVIIKHVHYINVAFMLITGESTSIMDNGSSQRNNSTTDLKYEIVYPRGEFNASDKLELSSPGTPTCMKAKTAANESDELHLSRRFK